MLLDIQEQIIELGYEILLIISTALDREEKIFLDILNSNICVKTKYFENIEEIYSLADAYIFPIKGLGKDYFPTFIEEIGVIDMPLSILEALSVGIPVITTDVDAIHTLISNNNDCAGVLYFDGTTKQFISKLLTINHFEFNNNKIREIIDDKLVIKKILSGYSELLG